MTVARIMNIVCVMESDYRTKKGSLKDDEREKDTKIGMQYYWQGTIS